MPYKMNAQETAPVTKAIDAARIESIRIEGINDPGKKSAIITFTKGEIVNGKYAVVTKEMRCIADDAEITAKLVKFTNLYADLKSACYELLVDKGCVPAGVVE